MAAGPRISLKRAYEPAEPGDGARILVERLWPRGVTKQAAALDLWAKAVAPSPELRRWYAHDATRWEEFRARYEAELTANAAGLEPLLELVRRGPVTFVYASREERRNSARVLREHVERLLDVRASRA